MKKIILTLVLIATPVTSAFALSDIANSDFKSYIEKAHSEQIISGYSDGTFRPNNPVSFVESLKMAINTGPHKNKINQSLVNGSDWHTPYSAYYFKNQKAPNIAFSNNARVTRDFAIYLILRQLDIELDIVDIKKIPANFSDVNQNSPVAKYILFAKYVGIVNGYGDGRFGPKNTITRGEFTKMLWKSLRENSTQIQEKYLELVTDGILGSLDS